MPFWTDRRALLTGAAGMAATSLGACANGRIIGFDKANKTLDIANQGEPKTLDPHKTTGTWESNIVGNMFLGLVTENAESEPIPGMAERWEVSDDGLTWTFFLRRALWSDGEACDAHDFEFAFRRILDPATLAEYASILYAIKNAEAVNNPPEGAAPLPPDRIGVTAIDDLTLEIQLEHPAPYLLQLLKHATAYPIPKHLYERHGDDWVKPANIAVNGPYTLKRWWSNYIVHLEKSPGFYDARNVVLEHLYFYPGNDVNAAARKVRSGEAGWSTLFPRAQIAQLRRALPGYVHEAPYLSCGYFSFNTTRRPFNDKRVRLAIAMSYDRDFVAHAILGSGVQPAYKFVPPGIANAITTARYSWASVPIAERKQEAARLLRDAGYGPNNPLRFVFSHRNTSDNPRVAVVAQNDWRSIAPWVTVELRGGEVGVHYDNLRARNYECGDGGWTADFNDAKNYLFLLETRSGAQNYTGYSNPVFDELVRLADFEVDSARRAELMARAEQTALDDAPICMSTFGNSLNLVHPDLAGYEDNLEDHHRARWFGIRNS
jgi:oligopeptide transport system substrate-binding protein